MQLTTDQRDGVVSNDATVRPATSKAPIAGGLGTSPAWEPRVIGFLDDRLRGGAESD